MVDVLHSDKLAWRVICELKLYQAASFKGRFDSKFPGFRVSDSGDADPVAQAWLLDRFSRHLRVQSLPRTMLIEVRFRSRDAALSAAVVNRLIRDYSLQEDEAQVAATAQAAALLGGPLKELKATVDQDQEKLAEFEKKHGILSAPVTVTENAATEAEHNGAMLAVDELQRQLVAATADRILREAEFRAASKGDPAQVLASDAQLGGSANGFATAGLQQIRARRSDLEQERAQLSAEHGENFPRVVEIGRQLADLDRQKKAEDAKLVAQFQGAWHAAQDREQLVRRSMEEATGEGLKQNRAEVQYAAMRQEAERSHDLYMRVEEKVEEAGLTSGIDSANIEVVDPARLPVKPEAPNLPLYMAITFFVGLWVALGGALLVDAIESAKMRAAASLLLMAAALTAAHGQAPTPSTSGLPTGVAKLPQSSETRSQPDARTAPAVWDGAAQAGKGAAGAEEAGEIAAPAPIGPGDLLEISEYRTPEFRSRVRVSAAGTVVLPMIGEVKLSGLDDQAAARAIEAELVKQKMLLHPMVSVLVVASAGQDVSVLGEVARPGMYPYTVHHRLLDAISEASGLAPAAGRTVTIYHRADPETPHTIMLASDLKDAGAEHNPELSPGDTVEVSRAGLVYVVGDVIRPGGFTLDPAQKLTVVQALALAWGPTQNAATTKALLIREQNGGRTVMALNVKRLLRGLDPDLPVENGDIVFIPDSAAKNLWNRSMESAIQSAVGVTIYSGLVYSQRY